MKRLTACLATALLLALAAARAAEDAPALREDHPTRYEVIRGDTLWDIAGRFLEDPWRWPELWRANSHIENPHLIYPGDVIILRFVDGAPVLSLRRAGEELPRVKLEPRIRRQPFTSPIPAIALEDIDALLRGNRVESADALDEAAYFLGTERGTLMGAVGDVIYARGPWEEGVSAYQVLRPGRTFTDPANGEVLGTEAIFIGEANLRGREEDRAVLEVTASERELRRGDLLMPREETVINATYFPRPPSFPLEARILDIGEGLAYGGRDNNLIISAGQREGVEIGHLLTLQKPERLIEDPKTGEPLSFPGEKYARVLIYRVFDKTSMALVLSSDRQIRMDDRVVTP